MNLNACKSKNRKEKYLQFCNTLFHNCTHYYFYFFNEMVDSITQFIYMHIIMYKILLSFHDFLNNYRYYFAITDSHFLLRLGKISCRPKFLCKLKHTVNVPFVVNDVVRTLLKKIFQT